MQRVVGPMQRRRLLRQWLPRLPVERLWWYLALASVLMLLGQEIARSSALILAAQAASDFEGFELEADELDEEAELLVSEPPPIPQRRGVETDRGPPAPAVESVQSQDVAARSSGGGESVVTVAEDKARQEWWDEDEFEGFPVDEQGVQDSAGAGLRNGIDEAGKGVGDSVQDEGKSKGTKGGGKGGAQSFLVEAFVGVFLIVFGVTYYLGRKANENIALNWAALFAAKDTIFDKNFSLLGTGDGVDSPLLLKEGQNLFKFYASGRRYCQSLLATLDLQSRHDLLARMWYVLSPKKDELLIEVNMNVEAMDPFTFAITRRKQAKILHKESKDLQQFATILSSSFHRKGISDEVTVISESREIALELLKDPVIDQLLGEKAFAKHGKYFLSLHFTDQYLEGSHKKVLQFKFVIPPIEQLEDLTRLIAIVPYFIDVVGRFKLSKEALRKAEDARSKIAKEVLKETQSLRQEALLRKKEEKRRVLEEVEIKLSPEVLRKREERERARQMKKSMPKIKMTRVH